MQVLGKTKSSLHSVFGDFEFLVQIHLTAVRLVRDADYIRALRQQLGVLSELVNGGKKDPATVAPF